MRVDSETEDKIWLKYARYCKLHWNFVDEIKKFILDKKSYLFIVISAIANVQTPLTQLQRLYYKSKNISTFS